MKTYIKEVKGLKIEVEHGRCAFFNYNPQEVSILTKEGIDEPVLGRVTLTSNGVSNEFKLLNFDVTRFERTNPSMMVLR